MTPTPNPTAMPDSTQDAVDLAGLEPLLGPVDLTKVVLPGTQPGQFNALTGNVAFTSLIEHRGHVCMGPLEVPTLDWIIVGGESGHNARPGHPDWSRSLRDQCTTAGVPFLFKQWGEWHPDALAYTDAATGECPPGRMKIGKKAAGRLLDGVTHDGFPA